MSVKIRSISFDSISDTPPFRVGSSGGQTLNEAAHIRPAPDQCVATNKTLQTNCIE